MQTPTLKPTYAEQQDLVSDLRDIFSTINAGEIRTVTTQFKNLTLELPRRPLAIELIRCYETLNPTAVVAHGSAVSFNTVRTGAKITRIDGLTEGVTTYTMIFRVTYV